MLYRNLDLDQIIEDCKRGRINGFKNFQVDGGLEVVQEAAGLTEFFLFFLFSFCAAVLFIRRFLL